MRRLLRWCVPAFVSIALLELLLRIYNPIPFRVRGNRIVLHPHETFTVRVPGAVKVDQIVRYRTNILGFRGPEPPSDLPKRLSVVAVGGSTTGCFLLNDGDTWPDRLQAALVRRFPDIWINNAGMDGQSTYGHLVLMRDYVADMHPKVVLFLIGLNDVALSAANWYDSEATSRVLTTRERTTEFLVSHSELAALVHNAWRARLAQKYALMTSEMDYSTLPRAISGDDSLERRARGGVPGYKRRVEELVKAARQGGISPVLITSPALYGDGSDPTTGIDFSTRRVNDYGNGQQAWRALEMYNDVTRSVARERRVPLVDLARELPKDSRYFSDLVHFSKAGAIAVAAIVSETPIWER